MLGEDGFFEVVYQGDAAIFLRAVGNAGEWFCIEAVTVGVGCGDGEGGFEQDDGMAGWSGGGGDNLAAPGAAGGSGIEKKGYVGAERCGHCVQIGRGKGGFKLTIEG